jgi:hypothetical protein
MKFKMTVSMDNEAFNDDDKELARILGKLAQRLSFRADVGDGGILIDINGNKVGTWKIK